MQFCFYFHVLGSRQKLFGISKVKHEFYFKLKISSVSIFRKSVCEHKSYTNQYKTDNISWHYVISEFDIHGEKTMSMVPNW